MVIFRQDIAEFKLNNESYFLDINKQKFFLRVFDHHQTDIERVVNTFNTWNQGRRPKMIVNVIGGANNFVLSSKLMTSFKAGISMIAEKTHALIITGYYTGYLSLSL